MAITYETAKRLHEQTRPQKHNYAVETIVVKKSALIFGRYDVFLCKGIAEHRLEKGLTELAAIEYAKEKSEQLQCDFVTYFRRNEK